MVRVSNMVVGETPGLNTLPGLLGQKESARTYLTELCGDDQTEMDKVIIASQDVNNGSLALAEVEVTQPRMLARVTRLSSLGIGK